MKPQQPIRDPPANQAKPREDQARKQPDTGKESEQNNQTSGFWDRSTTPTMAEVTANNLLDGFQEVDKNKKRKRKQRATPKGTGNESQQLLSGSTTFKVVITNVHESVTTEALNAFFQEKNIDPPSQIEDLSSPEWNTKRFVLTLPLAANDNVMDASFWPKGIIYKKWFARRGK